MKTRISRTVIVIAAVVLSGCGDDPTVPAGEDDRQAIETTVREYYDARAAQDGERVASLLSETCDLDPATVDQELQAGTAVEFEVTQVEVLNLTESSADVRVTGNLSAPGSGDSVSASGPPTPVVKEGNEWRIADCDFGGPG